MEITEQAIRERAFARISRIFGVPVDQLRYDSEFGKDLKVSSVFFLRDTELDQVFYDIEDVIDRETEKKIRAGLHTINICTVGDYCDHMVHFYKTMPKDVSIVLGFVERPPTQWARWVVPILFVIGPSTFMVMYIMYYFFNKILNVLNGF